MPGSTKRFWLFLIVLPVRSNATLLERGGLDNKHSRKACFGDCISSWRQLADMAMNRLKSWASRSMLAWVAADLNVLPSFTGEVQSVAVPQFTKDEGVCYYIHPTFGSNFKQYDRLESKRCCYSGKRRMQHCLYAGIKSEIIQQRSCQETFVWQRIHPRLNGCYLYLTKLWDLYLFWFDYVLRLPVAEVGVMHIIMYC